MKYRLHNLQTIIEVQDPADFDYGLLMDIMRGAAKHRQPLWLATMLDMAETHHEDEVTRAKVCLVTCALLVLHRL